MIYRQMMGVKDAQGKVLLLCNECKAPAEEATTILKVCSICGVPLGEWKDETERDTELESICGRGQTEYLIELSAGRPVISLNHAERKSVR
jgi:hypothetical protein